MLGLIIFGVKKKKSDTNIKQREVTNERKKPRETRKNTDVLSFKIIYLHA